MKFKGEIISGIDPFDNIELTVNNSSMNNYELVSFTDEMLPVLVNLIEESNAATSSSLNGNNSGISMIGLFDKFNSTLNKLGKRISKRQFEIKMGQIAIRKKRNWQVREEYKHLNVV